MVDFCKSEGDLNYSSEFTDVTDKDRRTTSFHVDEPLEPYIRKQRPGSKQEQHTEDDDLLPIRLKINSRERRRMHDLNSALDGLRQVIPYAQGASSRRLSKIATMLLARNHIVMLSQTVDELKKLVAQQQASVSPQQSTSPHMPTPKTTPPGPSPQCAVSSASAGIFPQHPPHPLPPMVPMPPFLPCAKLIFGMATPCHCHRCILEFMTLRK